MKKEFENTGYFVTPCGMIFGKYKPDQPLTTPLDRYGYKKVSLSVNGKMKTTTVHRIVALTFIPNPHGCKTVNHKDGNKLNNHVDNLEWCSSQQNTKHAAQTGLMAKGERVHRAVITEEQAHTICKMIADGYRNGDVAKAVDTTREIVSNIRLKLCWKHVSDDYDFKPIPHQGISMATFYWVCHKLQEGWKYKQILEAYTGGEYLTYSCVKKIKRRKMRPEFSKDFNF